MKPTTWSLRALFAFLLVIAASLAALRRPTDDVAFAMGLALTAALLAAVAVAVGATGERRRAWTAFVLVAGLVVYLNEPQRQSLASLPSFSDEAAEWLNERFAWAEWKGPPRTFVYWADRGRVRYVSFDAAGNMRSTGLLNWSEAERKLGGAIDLAALPDQLPLPRPNLPALQRIVTLSGALTAGVLAALLASAAGGRAVER